MSLSIEELRRGLAEHGQEHVLAFWDSLDEQGRTNLAGQIETIDFQLMERLIAEWVLDEPPAERFREITPVPTIPKADSSRADAREAWEAGEEALRAGRVGLLLVAGGQGTRLGFDGPKGAYPIGPVTKRSLFAYHADKLHNAQDRYGCTLPWYIMVSDTNETETKTFFRENGHFGLKESQIKFFRQRMAPCVDERGKFMLEEPGSLAMNPNGHGGVIPAIVENGIARDANERGVDTLSYFQVDNWAIKSIDPYFIGYHVLRGGDMSSKIHRKNEPREAVGVHCLCDGEYRVIEYSELDIYPQLLETDKDGLPRYYAGNPAMHVISLGFIERVNDHFVDFPWHRAHKKIAYVGADGRVVKPDKPNGYKFETFVFDALRFIRHDPIALEIGRLGEYTPIKSFEGDNSVVAAWSSMREYWGGWLEAAGHSVPRDAQGKVAIEIEISPRFAFSKDEFLSKASQLSLPDSGNVIIAGDGAAR
ncbi:MAG: UTP--glucose-1-phosphate uridylyltransferase [Candidatus Hydrogenedentes bacterium]|nr:UTP--glucose-1-phosphate uridylyltransferase [Candidatus Hydrogenedentota bacterium]